jgi:hypothetical protein
VGREVLGSLRDELTGEKTDNDGEEEAEGNRPGVYAGGGLKSVLSVSRQGVRRLSHVSKDNPADASNATKDEDGGQVDVDMHRVQERFQGSVLAGRDVGIAEDATDDANARDPQGEGGANGAETLRAKDHSGDDAANERLEKIGAHT